jgi:hypothetical protein
MVALESCLLEFALEVGTDRFPRISKYLEDSLRDDALPVFWHKDQMRGERENHMASSPKVS